MMPILSASSPPQFDGGKMSVLVKATSGDGVVINKRYKRVEFEAEDGSIAWARVRTSLLFEEIERLTKIDISGDLHDLKEFVAPFIEDWNLQIEDASDGEIYRVVPPMKGGVESLEYAPGQLIVAIAGAMIHENFEKVNPKSLTPVETTEKP
jgi:hypothetical protein